ncbi:hypothetical protein QBC44DRAFT_304946 [Cladorrhinum sp. PSN332]|nr:hypothetical protein QBC44DRAFT_304946 [Cladorrhinum sp. PSN332]
MLRRRPPGRLGIGGTARRVATIAICEKNVGKVGRPRRPSLAIWGIILRDALAATTASLWRTLAILRALPQGSGGSEPLAVLETTTTAKIICGDGVEQGRQVVRGWMNMSEHGIEAWCHRASAQVITGEERQDPAGSEVAASVRDLGFNSEMRGLRNPGEMCGCAAPPRPYPPLLRYPYVEARIRWFAKLPLMAKLRPWAETKLHHLCTKRSEKGHVRLSTLLIVASRRRRTRDEPPMDSEVGSQCRDESQ